MSSLSGPCRRTSPGLPAHAIDRAASRQAVGGPEQGWVILPGVATRIDLIAPQEPVRAPAQHRLST